MIINVGLRFNRNSRKFWVSGASEKDKEEFNKFIKFYSSLEGVVSRKIISLDLRPQNDQDVENCFNLLKPILTSIINVEVGTEIKITETEIINNWNNS